MVAGRPLRASRRAAKPLPRRLAVRMAGAATSSGGGSAFPYTTSFAGTENPIVEDGGWTNGTAATNWNAVQTTGGIACATAFNPSTEDDSMCVRSGLNAGGSGGHYVEGVLYIGSGYSPSVPHEAELLTCVTVGPGASITLYEALFSYGSSFQLMRWNGARSDFTPLGTHTSSNGGIQTPVDGMVCRAEFRVVGGNAEISVYQDGLLREVFTDSDAAKLTAGTQAGIGFFCRGGSGTSLSGMGWASLEVGNL